MTRYLIPTFAFLFPFLYYFRLIVPNSSLLILGNDFGILYYSYKGYLADVVANGHFPLWTPAEACGYPFFGNPFAAAAYPLNVFPILARLIVGNYNYWFHQIFTVFGVSLFALGTYRWLLQSFNRPAAACFAAVVLSTSWSIANFMRFPNAIHSLAWVPWVLVAILAAHQGSRLRAMYGGVFALFCQLTAGYPYFVVYSFFLYGAYALYLHWQSPGELRARLVRLAFVLGTPVLLAAPYVSAVSRTLAVTTDRAGGDFAYATGHTFGPVDFVASALFPPGATVEGCFYVGTLSVFLAALYLWRGHDAREKAALMIGAMAAIALIFGFRSYLFAPAWSFVPFLGQMRVFGRMTVILLPLLAIVIHQGYELLRAELERRVEERRLARHAVWLVFGGILLVQVLLYSMKVSVGGEYQRYQLPHLPGGSLEIDFLFYTLLTLCVVLFVLRTDWASVSGAARIVPPLLLLVVTMDTGTQGRFLWTTPLATFVNSSAPASDGKEGLMTRAWRLAKRKAQFHHLIASYFSLDRNNTNSWLTPDGLAAVPVLNFDFDTYTEFYRRTQPLGGALEELLGKRKLFFHRALHAGAPEFLADTAAAAALASEPKIERFDGNELIVSLSNSEPGHLTWIDNFDAGWSAELNGRAIPIERSMTTFKAVALPRAGQHRIRFSYRPDISGAAFGGAALGAVALVAPLAGRLRLRKRSSGG